MVVLLNQKILHGELLSPRPPHDGFRYDDPLLIRERDSQREGFPGRIGRSPESRQPVQERFQIVPWPWNGPALYVAAQCTGKRRKGRIEKGIGASQGGVL